MLYLKSKYTKGPDAVQISKPVSVDILIYDRIYKSVRMTKD